MPDAPIRATIANVRAAVEHYHAFVL